LVCTKGKVYTETHNTHREKEKERENVIREGHEAMFATIKVPGASK
jgi:hypothetical protein